MSFAQSGEDIIVAGAILSSVYSVPGYRAYELIQHRGVLLLQKRAV